MEKSDEQDVSYYYDGDRVLACIDRGYGGIFHGRLTMKAPEEWSFIVPGSLDWDSYHRNIYEGYHDFDPCPAETAADLPPLPPVPEYTRVSWHENFGPKEPLEVEGFPKISEEISRSAEGLLRIFFILEEDLYESKFGDGTFLYYHHDVFLSEEEAAAYAYKQNKALEDDPEALIYYRHKKFCTFRIEYGVIVSDDWMPESSEHYKLEELVRDTEDLLAGRMQDPAV
jgi:hypothetical protein